MPTKKQTLGVFGENFVRRNCSCPKCKKDNTFKLLPTNFKCSDIICDFCGFLGQVKTSKVKEINILPKRILGAAWKPQKERMDSGLYFSLYLVLVDTNNNVAVYFLPAELQEPEMFIVRKPLSANAKRAGWQGYYYQVEAEKFVRLI